MHDNDAYNQIIVRQLVREYLSNWNLDVPGSSTNRSRFSNSGFSRTADSLLAKKKESWFSRLRKTFGSADKNSKIPPSIAAPKGGLTSAARLLLPFLGVPGRILAGILTTWGLVDIYKEISPNEEDAGSTIDQINSALTSAADDLLGRIEQSDKTLISLGSEWPKGNDISNDLADFVTALKETAKNINDKYQAGSIKDVARSSLGITVAYPPVDGIESKEINQSMNAMTLVGLAAKLEIDAQKILDELKDRYDNGTAGLEIDRKKNSISDLIKSQFSGSTLDTINQAEIL